MSEQNLTGGVNPFAVAQRWMANRYEQGLRQQRDVHQAHLIHDTLAIHAATHEATLKQASQQARLTEKAEKGKSQRATEFLQTIHGMAEPGTQVKISHGDISAGFTKAAPKPPTPPSPGRVPVKKSRGGKKNR